MDLIIYILVLLAVKQIIRTPVRIDIKINKVNIKQPCRGDKLLLNSILWKISKFFVNLTSSGRYIDNICDVKYRPMTDHVLLKKNKN